MPMVAVLLGVSYASLALHSSSLMCDGTVYLELTLFLLQYNMLHRYKCAVWASEAMTRLMAWGLLNSILFLNVPNYLANVTVV